MVFALIMLAIHGNRFRLSRSIGPIAKPSVAKAIRLTVAVASALTIVWSLVSPNADNLEMGVFILWIVLWPLLGVQIAIGLRPWEEKIKTKSGLIIFLSAYAFISYCVIQTVFSMLASVG